MDFKEICKRDDYQDISLDLRDITEKWKWTTLVMPEMIGKTTLLSLAYYYFDCLELSYDLFKDSELASKWKLWKLYLNRYVVLALDFSDFDEEDMEAARKYVANKMAKIYYAKLPVALDSLSDDRVEYYMQYLLNYENGNEVDVEGSLTNLLYCFYHGEYSEDNSVLLMDGISNLEKKAREYGYENKMVNFLRRFLDFEPDKLCSAFLQIADQDDYEDYFCYDLSFLPHTNRMQWHENNEIRQYDKRGYDAQIVNYTKIDEDIKRYLMLKGENIYLKNRNKRYLLLEKHDRETEEKYSKPIRPEMCLFSENVGLRRLKLLDRNSKYYELNDIVKDIYVKTRRGNKNVDVYSEMQHVGKERTDWDKKAFDELVEKCSDLHEGWEISLHSNNNYWMQIEIGERTNHHSIAKIKVYVTTKCERVKDLLIGAIERLMGQGHESFEVMVSKVQRDGNICFFLGREEFFIVEKYFKEHTDEIIKGSRFIARRGMLGISRDLMDIDSHNGQQAKLLNDYFSLIDDPEEIDIEEMYRLFVLGWNGELANNNVFSKDFKGCTAQMFVIMLDTLDVLLGRAEIDDNSLLLNDDSNIWSAFADAKCWGELEWQK